MTYYLTLHLVLGTLAIVSALVRLGSQDYPRITTQTARGEVITLVILLALVAWQAVLFTSLPAE